MKALTIKEPWATLIIDGYKKYEFSDLFYTQIPFSLPYKSMNISITLPNKQENIVALEELFLHFLCLAS